MSLDLEIDFSVPSTGLARGKGPQITAEEMLKATEIGLALVQAAVVPKTPVGVTGLLRGAWQTSIVGEKVEIKGRLFNPLLYAMPVEAGSKAHFPPTAPLELWVRRKLDVTEKDVRGVAFCIARAISRRGGRAVRMAQQGFAATKGQIQAGYEAALGRIKARLVAA